MPNVTLSINTKQIDRLANELKEFPREVGEATRLALNRTIDHAITKTGQIVPKFYVIKSAEVKASFKGGIKRPSKSDLSASITSSGPTLSLAHFPYTPKSPKRGGKSIFRNAVMVTIKKSKGKVISKKGFVASTGAKSEDKTQFNVFMRVGNKRLPIAPIRTLSIPQMITAEGVDKQIMNAASSKFEERLEHEIVREMTKMDKAIRG
ncbi:hypothetical protein D2A34_21880 [Clostridium chromiireducens]|uniref:Prophage minor tail protein Z n=1 Tax=Clostridium chromiireducens TaxID=225345 RepID=A0A399IIL1_9CLOT|nr:phage tail protein [Clostridium chromiireducens]RII32848.1 hypothetical protein D2A34_21880 [Clostridium chromiireducens]